MRLSAHTKRLNREKLSKPLQSNPDGRGVTFIAANALLAYLLIQYYEVVALQSNVVNWKLLIAIPLLLAPMLSRGFIEKLGSYTISKILFAYLALIISIFISIAYQFWMYSDAITNIGLSAHDFLLDRTAVAIIYSLIGFGLANVKLRESILASFVLIVLMLSPLIMHLGENYTIDWSLLSSRDFPKISHLSVDSEVAFLGALAIALTSSRTKALYLILTLAALYMIGSRASLYAFLLTGILYVFTQFTSRSKTALYYTTTAAFVTLALAASDISLDPRLMFEGGVLSDASFEKRLLQLRAGIPIIMDYPIFGNFSAVVTEFNSRGSYIHSILSAWQMAGVMPFMILICLLVRGFREGFSVLSNPEPSLQFFGIFFIYSVIAVLTAKVFTFWPLWFSLGLYVGSRQQTKYFLHRNTMP